MAETRVSTVTATPRPAQPASAKLWLAPGLLAGLWLRVHRLGDQNVWWDEGLAAWAARQPPDAIARWTAADVHPPLYFWLLHFWRLAAGESEFGLRLLSALVGVLAIAAAYRLGRHAGGPWTGVLAALLLAVSRFHITWSQEMRMYALTALLAALALWAALRVWDRGRPGDWAAYVLTMTAGLYSLYLFVSVLVIVNLVWFIWNWPAARSRAREFWRWSAAQAAVLALFAPWLAYALGRIPTWSATEGALDIGTYLQIYWTILATGDTVAVEQVAVWTLPVLAVMVAGVAVLINEARADRRRAHALSLLLFGLTLPALVVYLVSLPRDAFFYAPPLAPRYLILFVAAYAVLLAWGLVRLGAGRRRPLGALGLAVVLLAAGSGLARYYPGRVLSDDYKSMAMTLNAYRRRGDAVILVNDQDWPIFAYHYADKWLGLPRAWRLDAAQADAYLQPIWAAHEAVWLALTPYAGTSDPQNALPAWLAARARASAEFAYQDKVLRLYARTADRAATLNQLNVDAGPATPLNVSLAGGDLTGFSQAVREFRPGDTLHVFLYWRSGGNGPVEVGLRGADGRLWPGASPAGRPEPGRQQIDLIVPPDAPPGAYRVYAADGSGALVELGRARVLPSAAATATADDIVIPRRLEADFGRGVRLLGCHLPAGPFAPGEAVPLTLFWKTAAPIARRYKVFTHLIGAEFNPAGGGFLWGQKDNEPAHDQRPTTTWRVGEVIVDEYELIIDPAAPPGEYTITAGLYEPAGGARLPVLDAAGAPLGDSVTVATITVRSP